MYPEVNNRVSFPELEEKILAFWKQENIFQQSLDKNKRDAGNDYIFYDGKFISEYTKPLTEVIHEPKSSTSSSIAS